MDGCFLIDSIGSFVHSQDLRRAIGLAHVACVHTGSSYKVLSRKKGKMARNEEKAQSMFYRFRKAIQNEEAGWINPSPNEPLLPSTCESLPAALFARRELLKDISRKISRINEESLKDEEEIRVLNDEINRLIRRKNEWDGRLRELGHEERDKTVRWGEDVLPEPGNQFGYFYFGKAKTLPGVQDLLHPHKETSIKLPAKLQTFQDALSDQRLHDVYYGVLEAKEETEMQAYEREMELAAHSSNRIITDTKTGLPAILTRFDPNDPVEAPKMRIPTQKEIEEAIIQYKKNKLAKEYLSEAGGSNKNIERQ